MKTGTLLKISLTGVLLFTIVGAWMKVSHVAGADAVLIAGIVAQLLFVSIAIYEVASSPRLKRGEKWMWAIAFILMGGITGLVYLLVGRKGVVAPA